MVQERQKVEIVVIRTVTFRLKMSDVIRELKAMEFKTIAMLSLVIAFWTFFAIICLIANPSAGIFMAFASCGIIYEAYQKAIK